MSRRAALVMVLIAGVLAGAGADEAFKPTPLKDSGARFNPKTDLISLHYDHAPDRDDGQSAAADRTILESLYDRGWIKTHVIPVSGATGKNDDRFVSPSNVVMDAVWSDAGGWVAAHDRRDQAQAALVARWSDVLKDGGDIWVKEGGQSDITATVVKAISKAMPDVHTIKRIHVVQHSNWNEKETTDAAREYVRQHTDYIRICDANAYLAKRGGDPAFEKAALAHPKFGKMWRAAFDYLDPKQRIDFSDTGELMRIVGLGEMNIDAFGARFLGK